MNKRKSFAFFLTFVLFLQATTLFAGTVEEVCFQNSFGQLFRFSGGKLAKKAYVVEFFSAGCGFVPGLATTMKDSSGDIILAIHIADSDACSAVVWYFVGDPLLLTASGTFDNYPRSLPPHGADSLSRTNCLGFPKLGTTTISVPLPSDTPGSENK